jgi:hypothetical protein
LFGFGGWIGGDVVVLSVEYKRPEGAKALLINSFMFKKMYAMTRILGKKRVKFSRKSAHGPPLSIRTPRDRENDSRLDLGLGLFHLQG